MIEIKHAQDCSGCAACADICPQKCINITDNEEGFPFARVDVSKCINCGLCNKVCPIENQPKGNSINKVFAAKSKDFQERMRSSSGGIFGLIAVEYIRKGGVVVACRLDDDMKAMHAFAEDEEGIQAMMSSKYVQSDTRGIYSKVRDLLKTGREVLFVGTPCQVAALKLFLMRPYENLTMIDILCHGVPSPLVFKEYKDRLEDRYGAKMQSLSFRGKQKGWKRLHIDARFKNGKRHHMYAGYDSFMQLFLSDSLQRSSCFNCPYNQLDRPGDITLGDFWGIGKSNYAFDDDKGVSLIITNNEKGKKLWQLISDKVDWFESDINSAIAGNAVLVRHLPSSHKRDEFYKEFVDKGYDDAIRVSAPEASKIYQLTYNFLRWGLDLKRKILKEAY